MFLELLNEAQRRELLVLSHDVILADRRVHHHETELLTALEHELHVWIDEKDLGRPADLSVFTGRKVKLAALLKLCSMAYIDRSIHPFETAELKRIGSSFKFNPDEIQTIDIWGRRHLDLVAEAESLVAELAAAKKN
jgi:hypothetical protein